MERPLSSKENKKEINNFTFQSKAQELLNEEIDEVKQLESRKLAA